MLEKQFSDLPKEFKDKLSIGDTIYEATPLLRVCLRYKWVLPLFEMFKIDKEMQNIILKNPIEQDIYKLARSRDAYSPKEDAIIKSIRGEIPFQEIYNF